MHFTARIVLCLVVGLPTLVNAQTADAPVASPQESPPPLITAPPEAAPAPPESEPPPARGELIPGQRYKDSGRLFVPRVVTGTLLGTLAGAGGLIGGFLVGLSLTDCDTFDDVCDGGELFPVVAPTVIGAGALSALTVYAMGSVFDGNGHIGATLLGGLAGASAGALATFGGLGYGGVLLMPPFAALGAVIAYEISGADLEPDPSRRPGAGSSLQMIPVLSVTPGGGVLGGLTGRF